MKKMLVFNRKWNYGEREREKKIIDSEGNWGWSVPMKDGEREREIKIYFLFFDYIA
jgi:hypothetical protein